MRSIETNSTRRSKPALAPLSMTTCSAIPELERIAEKLRSALYTLGAMESTPHDRVYPLDPAQAARVPQ